MWTVNDRRFLKSLRIEPDEPPPAPRRYHAEPGVIEGEYVIVDKGRKPFGIRHMRLTNFPDPRAAAADIARQLNEEHERQREQRNGKSAE